MRPFIEELSNVADTFVCAYPNAGLPNPLAPTGYDELPENTAEYVLDFANSGFINIAGGCCGTTPGHIRAIAEAVKNVPPRKVPIDRTQDPLVRAGAVEHRRRFAVRQRRRAYQRHRFASLCQADSRRQLHRSGCRGSSAGGKRRADH